MTDNKKEKKDTQSLISFNSSTHERRIGFQRKVISAYDHYVQQHKPFNVFS